MSHAQPHMHAHSQYSHTNDAVDANQKVFDRMAHTWDNPCMRSVSQQNANAVLQLLRATGHLRPDAAVLDFACGGGDITMLLQPHIGSIVGADVSTGMLHLLEQRAEKQGVTDKVDTLHLEKGELPVETEPFDAIICLMAYHHFDDPATVTKMLAAHLKPNGILLVLDGKKKEISKEDRARLQQHHGGESHAVPHHFGLDDSALTQYFKQAELVNSEIHTRHSISKKELASLEGSDMMSFLLHENEDGDELRFVIGTAYKA